MENQLNFDIPSTSEKLRAKKADPVTGISLYSKLHRAKLSIGKVVKNAIDIDSGQMIESWLSLPLITDPQKMISATTYYRRATLQAILALQAVDDDGKEVSNSKKELPSITDERFSSALAAIKKGTYTIESLKETYKLTPEQEAQL